MLFDFTLKLTFSLTGTCEDRDDADTQIDEADFGPCEDIETADIFIDDVGKEKTFTACMEARYHVSVEAESLAEAKAEAERKFSDEDFGEAEEIDMEFVNFTDNTEKIIEAEDFDQWAATHNAK